ncbi:phage tail tape measure protein, partial [Vibrio parahaemolyticus]
ERMADEKAQKKLDSIGVHATDAAKNFRPFLDVLTELAPKLEAMTDKARAQFLLDAFGHHALAGIGGGLTQLTNGVKSRTG